jgi:hypothetical protein
MRFGKVEAVKTVMDGLKYKAKGEVFTLTWKATTDDIQAAITEHGH